MAVLPVQDPADHTLVNQNVGGIEVAVYQPAVRLQLFQPPGFHLHYPLDPAHGILTHPGAHFCFIQSLCDEPSHTAKWEGRQ